MSKVVSVECETNAGGWDDFDLGVEVDSFGAATYRVHAPEGCLGDVIGRETVEVSPELFRDLVQLKQARHLSEIATRLGSKPGGAA